MSTRGLFGIKHGEKRYGFYHHSDSYPSYAFDQQLVPFVKSFYKVKGDKEVINEKKWKKFVSNAKKFKLKGDGVDCDTGDAMEMLQAIADGKKKSSEHDSEFIKDSLFCEWAYYVDLDNKAIEVWVGFQKKPFDKNPFGTEPESGSDKEYYPCRPIAFVPFDVIITVGDE